LLCSFENSFIIICLYWLKSPNGGWPIKYTFTFPFTFTAIVLAAGVTIGAVVRAITNALKATGKAMGAGLNFKEIVGKLGSLLPRVIGQVSKRPGSDRFPRRAHLAPDFGGRLCGRKIPQKAAPLTTSHEQQRRGSHHSNDYACSVCFMLLPTGQWVSNAGSSSVSIFFCDC